jgi:hypothetical protein
MVGMNKTTTLTTLMFLLALTPAVAEDASCLVGLRDDVFRMHAVVESCSSVGSFSLGGLYDGVWEKLTYNYPEPWKGTFFSVKVDDVVYASSEDPSDAILLDEYVSTKPRVVDSSIETEWILPEKIVVRESTKLVENKTLIEVSVLNTDSVSHNVGVRMHLDTMLGLNDGAPIYIPGEGLKTSEEDYSGSEIVFEYWKAYNRPQEPTIVATGMIDPKSGMTQPARIIVAEWKQSKNSGWDYEAIEGLSILGDSAVVLYYPLGMIEPGGTAKAVLSVGSEAPVLPPEKGLFGVTELLVDRVSGEYCPGEDAEIKVDVLSEGVARQGQVNLIVAGGDGLVYFNNTVESVFPAGVVKSLSFVWKIKEKDNITLPLEFSATAILLNESGVVDFKARDGLIRVDAGKCVTAESGLVKIISNTLSCIPGLMLVVVLALAAAFILFVWREASKGRVVVSKLQDHESVQVAVLNKTGRTLEDVVVEDAIPQNAEIDVSTLNVVRRWDYLSWEVGDLKPGAEAVLEYRLKDVAVEPDVVVKWRGGVATHRVKK